MEFLSGQFLQPKATLMLFDSVFHRGMLQVPHYDLPPGEVFLVGDRGMILPVQVPGFGLGHLPFHDVAVGLSPPVG